MKAIGKLKALMVIYVLGFSSRLHATELENTSWKTDWIGNEYLLIQKSLKILESQKAEYSSGIVLNFGTITGRFKQIGHMSYRLGDMVPELDRTRRLFLTVNSVDLIPLDEETVSHYNKDKYCGFDDWEAGVARDVTGLKCEEDQEPILKGDVIQDLLRVNADDSLNMGKRPPGADKHYVPTVIDEVFSFKKQSF